ncbi:SpoIVB peptidase [Candidatus Epulonipiscium fishelsonii]|uniref:SpoIVB peptidase n=1 Tax=Candidatus Epulonipiscium fishelsonii TaxID=77094 RepID=A0ACC8XH89_9FIRM|nr:SpoIVB peptidase [Epulopiscium sp. SCG-B05WGA-EpuloA1]ONI43036.1 SpoIVB peptidase [Epulopiscium sp. SCG-B11WGA-EpuloA1]
MIIILPIGLLGVSYSNLPDEIKLIVGEEQTLDLNLPLPVQVSSKENIKIKEPMSVILEQEGKAELEVSVLGGIPLKTVSVSSMPYKEVIPGGQIIGIEVHSEGICVVGTGSFNSNGKEVNPCKDSLKKGDRIVEVDGVKINSKEEFKKAIEVDQEKFINLKIKRNEKTIDAKVLPKYCDEENAYKIGAWIKDTIQGLGTLTYVDPESSTFGALGHGITDSEFEKIIPISTGNIMTAKIDSIRKGKAGDPGELSGVINTNAKEHVGDIKENNTRGIFGTIDQDDLNNMDGQAIPIACQNEVEEGDALILADLEGEGVESYKVKIQKVAKYTSEPSKGMVIKIVDQELLNLTEGIVQGMSGSPIIQNNKLIGAVSHVFVQDPTKGYGIFVENMINLDTK